MDIRDDLEDLLRVVATGYYDTNETADRLIALAIMVRHGDCRRHPKHSKYLIRRDGLIIGPSGCVLRPFTGPGGYPCVNVMYDNGGRSQARVHVLVCETFHGLKPKNKQLVAHGDGNIQNYHADNLRWATFIENEEDKTKHGTRRTGDRHPRRKLSSLQVKEILKSCGTHKQLAAEYGVSPFAIGCIKRGETWKEIWVGT